jgi:peptide-methionine (R)-S-oxide reductase
MTPTRDQARRLALANGIARSALGVVALTAPSVALGPWVGPAARDRSACMLARALGGRDLALGLGTVLALRHGTPVRGWVEAGGLADAGDAMVTLAAFARLPRKGRWAVLTAALAGVVAARWSSPAVDTPPPPPVGG